MAVVHGPGNDWRPTVPTVFARNVVRATTERVVSRARIGRAGGARDETPPAPDPLPLHEGVRAAPGADLTHSWRAWMRPGTRRIAPAEVGVKAISLATDLGERAPWCRVALDALRFAPSL